ncbi:MAG: Oxidoreductase UcpA [Bacteroidia bacterium]|nr:Oxidoreductase UcpA [Bacteroidia bacterium]
MNIIVTGASQGIGYEVVKNFCRTLKSGKIITLSRNAENLEQLKNECDEINSFVRVIAVAADISSIKLQQTHASLFQNEMPHVDVLINNAGLLIKKNFSDLSEEDIYRVYNVNVFSVFRLVKILKPQMGGKQTTHIVNISSMGGFQGSSKFAGLSAYSSSKGAVAVLTECLAEEFKNDNIKVNCLALGAAQTKMLEEAFPGYKAPLSAEQMASFISNFALTGSKIFNGKILPVSLSTP